MLRLLEVRKGRERARETSRKPHHKYPGQTYRYAQDNGGTPPEFDIHAYLHGATLLSDYARLRSALMKPLTSASQAASFCGTAKA